MCAACPLRHGPPRVTTCGIFFVQMPSDSPTEDERDLRTAFFIDGFNLYHSINAVERDSPDAQLKWLDIPTLCQSHLYIVDVRARLQRVEYFTAYADHLLDKDPEKIGRHKALVRALKANKVKVHRGRFKKKDVWAESVGQWVGTHEEKETDVAITCRVLAGFARNDMDIAVMVTGDSDFLPLYREVRALYPGKRMLFAFPYGRVSKEIRRECPGDYFTIGREAYSKHQMPDQVRLPSGKFVTIPEAWKRT